VYVHRSGRTARANQTGTAVSLVAPEDALHHRAICQYLGFKSLPLLQVDLYSLPMLRQRVALAKQVRMFVQLLILRIP
jgi:ATP-dependent RNA helicase DDX24/MAK5